MPSAQVVDFGPDPFAEAAGNFATGFSQRYMQKQDQKRNEDIFAKIKSNYGPEANTDTLFKDVMEAEGLDQSYKNDVLKNIREYSVLKTKKDITPYQQAILDNKAEELNLKKDKIVVDSQEKPMTPYQRKVLENQQIRLENDKNRISNAYAKNERDGPKLVANYTNSLFKDTGETVSAEDKSFINGYINNLLEEFEVGVDEAFSEAYQKLIEKKEIVQTAKVSARPQLWDGTHFISSPSINEVSKAVEQATAELEQLYASGVTSQKDLRKIAKKGGWSPEEITGMLQKVFQSNGKRLRREKKSTPNPETADVDDILFGE